MDGYLKCKLEIFNFNPKHALRDFGLASRKMSNVSCLSELMSITFVSVVCFQFRRKNLLRKAAIFLVI